MGRTEIVNNDDWYKVQITTFAENGKIQSTPKIKNHLFTCYLNCMCKSNPVCLIHKWSVIFLLASYVQWHYFLVWTKPKINPLTLPHLCSLWKGMQFSVSLHPMNEYIFVLRSRQICLRTNSYADPNQHYNTNLNSHMHPSVHTSLGLLQFISFQNPQYYFCSC